MRIRELLAEAINVDLTLKNFGQKMAKRLKLDPNDPNASEKLKNTLDEIQGYDPTPNKQYTLWLLNNWLNGNIQQLEDAERAGSDLDVFHKNKQRLPQDKRDIGLYVPFTDRPGKLNLSQVVKQFQEENPSDDIQLGRDIEQAKKESVLIYQDSQVAIYRPTTELAGSALGYDTEWCTAYGYKFGKNPSLTNRFDNYNQYGPLYIFIFSDGTKYQLQTASNQFMNINDQPVELVNSKLLSAIEKIKLDKKYPNEFEKFLSQNFNKIHHDLLTPEICMAAVKQHGSALMYVPEKLQTHEICMAAVKQNGSALAYVSHKLKTPEICMEAIKKNGSALEYVPHKLKTPEICMAAVKQNGYGLYYVPQQLKTPEICMAAVKQSGSALAYVPEELRTPEICMAAVQSEGTALMYVPDKLKTPEICIAAVKEYADAVRYVPQELRQSVLSK